MWNINDVFMRTALDFAKLSKCVSVKVGAIAVKDNRIIATGVNGTTPGYYNCNDLFDEHNFDREEHHRFSEKYEQHAEMNLILYAAKNGISLDNTVLYASVHPCWNCIKHLSVVGVKKVIYYHEYDRMQNEIEDVQNFAQITGIEIIPYKNLR